MGTVGFDSQFFLTPSYPLTVIFVRMFQIARKCNNLNMRCIVVAIIWILIMYNLVPLRPLGRPRRRWVDNIRMDLQEVECGYMDWIGLTQDRDGWRTLVGVVMNLRVP